MNTRLKPYTDSKAVQVTMDRQFPCPIVAGPLMPNIMAAILITNPSHGHISFKYHEENESSCCKPERLDYVGSDLNSDVDRFWKEVEQGNGDEHSGSEGRYHAVSFQIPNGDQPTNHGGKESDYGEEDSVKVHHAKTSERQLLTVARYHADKLGLEAANYFDPHNKETSASMRYGQDASN